MSPRPPLGLERWGNIHVSDDGPPYTASAWYRDATGRRRRMRRNGRTKAIARRVLEDALLDTLTVTEGELRGTTRLRDLTTAWWAEWEETEHASQTLIEYRRARDDIAATIGDMRIREVSVPWADRYLKELAATRGRSVAKRHKTILKHMFELAQRHGAVDRNLIVDTRPPAVKRAAVVSPDAKAVDAMLALFTTYDERPRTQPFLRDFADILIATGARTNEVLALDWADVDLELGTVAVTGTVAYDADSKLVRQPHPKTDRGWRRLFVPRFAIGVLMERRTTALTDLVFPSSTGTLKSAANLRRSWREALADTDFVGVTPRGFRKAVATMLARELGADAAARQLGHTDTSVTKAHYIAQLHDGPEAQAVLERLSDESGQ